MIIRVKHLFLCGITLFPFIFIKKEAFEFQNHLDYRRKFYAWIKYIRNDNKKYKK